MLLSSLVWMLFPFPAASFSSSLASRALSFRQNSAFLDAELFNTIQQKTSQKVLNVQYCQHNSMDNKANTCHLLTSWCCQSSTKQESKLCTIHITEIQHRNPDLSPTHATKLWQTTKNLNWPSHYSINFWRCFGQWYSTKFQGTKLWQSSKVVFFLKQNYTCFLSYVQSV